MKRILKIHASDNTVVALEAIRSGDEIGVDGRVVTVLDDVPFGHKIAVVEIRQGDPVMKYGACIGIATQMIRQGEHVHAHNLVSVRGSVAQ